MCFGGNQPQAPEIKYAGPSDDDLRRQEAALGTYQKQINDQQTKFQQQLQSQIDAANAETEALRSQYRSDLDAYKETSAGNIADAEAAGAAAVSEAGAASAAQQVGAYTVTASESEPLQAQTTKATPVKKKPKKNLKISTAGTASGAGSGLNIGV